jgi:hypothetical protein
METAPDSLSHWYVLGQTVHYIDEVGHGRDMRERVR